MRKLFLLLLFALPVAAQTQIDRIHARGQSTFDSIANSQVVVITGGAPTVSNGNVFRSNNGGLTTITNFLGGVDSQRITVICGDANTTIQDNANIGTSGAADITCIVGKVSEFVFNSNSGKWHQTGAGSSTGLASATVVETNGSGGFIDNSAVTINNTNGNATTATLLAGVPTLCTGGTPVSTGIQANENANCTSSGAPGGSPPDIQVNIANAFSNGSGLQANAKFDPVFFGPNPSVDIRAYGARNCSPATTPCAIGLTATTTAPTPNATISNASTFVNGDGVVIYGAGAPHAMSTPGAPTVTPNVALAGTGTGIDAAGPSGGDGNIGTTTYNYQIIARDKNGGLTAASATGSTTTGQAGLGNMTAGVATITRSGTTNTVTMLSYVLSAAGNASGGNTAYTGTFSPVPNAGVMVTVTSFVNGVNNGTFPIVSANATTLTLANPSGTSETHAGTAQLLHGFHSGCAVNNCSQVYLAGQVDASFSGWYSVASVASTTTFTYVSNTSAASGGAASTTDGTVTWWNMNHVTWSAVTGAWEYYIYSDRKTPGSFTLIGVSNPNDITTDLTWDDFGSPMMDLFTFPPFVPTTPPIAATSDHLVSRIVSGAGTTNLVLANNAGTSVAGNTIRLDAAPAILAAATDLNARGPTGGTMLIPADNTFAVNSYLNLKNLSFAISQLGGLYLNETMELGKPNNPGVQWHGNLGPQYGLPPADTFAGKTTVTVDRAHPGVYINSSFASWVDGIKFASASSTINGALLVLEEGGFNSTWNNIDFVTSTSSADYMGIGFYGRGSVGQGISSQHLDSVLFSTGVMVASSQTNTPAWYCSLCGSTVVNSAYFLHRGAFIRASTAGAPLDVNWAYINGGFGPLFGINGPTNVQFKTVILDTFSHPCVSVFGGGSSAVLPTVNFTNKVCTPSSPFPPPVTGQVPVIGYGQVGSSNVNTNSIGTVTGLNSSNVLSTLASFNSDLAASTLNSIFINGVAPAAPTCTVNPGGSLTFPATWNFKIVPVWQNGAEGSSSYPAATPCTTSSGNQQITINWTPVAGGPKCYNVYASNGGGYGIPNTIGACLAPSSTVFSSFGFLSQVLGLTPAGGPTMMMPGVQGIAAPIVLIPGANGGVDATEGTGASLTAATSHDLLFADSTAHRFKMNNNNGGAFLIPGISTAGSSGNCVKLAANGIDLVDNGSTCGNNINLASATTQVLSVYNTPSSAVNANISAVNMVASTSAEHTYLFNWTISLVTPGTSCVGSTTVELDAIFTDPNGAGTTTRNLSGTLTIASSGNGTAGFIASGVDNIRAKTGTAVQYQTSNFTAGGSCSPAPTYKVYPVLTQLN